MGCTCIASCRLVPAGRVTDSQQFLQASTQLAWWISTKPTRTEKSTPSVCAMVLNSVSITFGMTPLLVRPNENALPCRRFDGCVA